MGQGLKKRLLGAGVLVLLLALLAPSLFKGGDSHPLNTAGQVSLEQGADKTALDEFVDAFIEGINPPDEGAVISSTQPPSDIHASEVIDAYAGIVDAPLQTTAAAGATHSDITSETQAASLGTATTGADRVQLESKDLNDIYSEASKALEANPQSITPSAAPAVEPGDEAAFVVVQDLPKSIDAQTGKPVAAPDLSEQMIETTVKAIVEETLPAGSPEAAPALAQVDMQEQPAVEPALADVLETLPTAAEAQAAQDAIKSVLPTEAPEVPAFVATLDTLPETVNVQTQEQAPVAAVNPAPGIDASGSLKAWALQLATFSDESNAIKLQDTLRAKGHTAYIRKTIRSNGRPLFRVFIGPEVRTEELDILKAQLEKEMGLSGMVVRFKS